MMLWEITDFELPEQTRKLIRAGGHNVIISPHVLKQQTKRAVELRDISLILTRLNRVKNQIRKIDPFVKFIVIDPETKISIGMMRTNEPDTVLFGTVYPGTGYDLDKPRIYIK
jgi:hypothetical protein